MIQRIASAINVVCKSCTETIVGAPQIIAYVVVQSTKVALDKTTLISEENKL